MIKVLWITNMLLPQAANVLGVEIGASGTWLTDICDCLAKEQDIQLAVACVRGKEFKKFSANGVTFYCLPGTGKNMLFYCKRFEKVWKKINEDFQPDIVHLHGTEYSHGLAFLRACPNVPAALSIQGVLNRIKDVDFGDVPVRELFWNRRREWRRWNGDIEMHFFHKKNAKYEREIVSRVKYLHGVNTWDTSMCVSMNPALKTFRFDNNLREEVYNAEKWSVESMQRHTIFTNPAGVPLKGLHQLLRAVALLKDKYPDILVKVPGMTRNGKLRKTDAYAIYIGKLIRKLGIEKNVSFIGRQTAMGMCEQMRSANATVIPSATESVSMILREAMYLGCPCVASFRGGMADFVSDKHDGFLYDYPEYPYLATRIDELFSNDELCMRFSKNAIQKAELAHNRERNVQEYIRMYKTIIEEERN